MNKFQKRLLTLRQILVGRRFFDALIAMEFASARHTGMRKDGVTPEFDHQVSIALHALTLPTVMYPEDLIIVIMLHDVREDYHVSDEEIRGLIAHREPDSVARISRAVENMTKEIRGVRKDEVLLFAAMAADPIASIAKLCDRVHNLQSMVGVFTYEKQVEYLREVVELFLPMAKKARRAFPHQTDAYENLKMMISSQMQLIRAIHTAAGHAPA